MRLPGDGPLTSASPGAGPRLPVHPPPGEVVISMRPSVVFANGPASETGRLQGGVRGPWRQAARAVMVLLPLHDLTAAQIAVLPDCHPATVRRRVARFNDEGLARRIAALLGRPDRAVVPTEDETRLNLLPHVRAGRTLRTARPEVPTPGTNRQVTVPGAPEVSSGRRVYRPGRRRAADFTALPEQVPWAFPLAPVIVVACDNDSTRTPARSTPGWTSIPAWGSCTSRGTARVTTRPGGSGAR